jgi:polyhydroxyalkanoate synthesis repressor PhaR
LPLIKRYPNRKLYDTEQKKYITLEGIAELIRQGQEIRVVDNATGEDLTTLTLTQVILELEKKQTGLLPHQVLSGLIKAGGEGFNALQRSITSSLTFWRQVDEEIRRRVLTLIQKGDLSEGEGTSLLEKLLSPRFRSSAASAETPNVRQEDIERVLSERQVPSRADLQTLFDQLDRLEANLNQLSNPPEAAQTEPPEEPPAPAGE